MLVEQHLVPQLGAVQLQSLNAAQINAHYARLLSEGRVHGSGGLSPNTVHHVHAVLHRALRDAVKWGYLQTNAAACADPPRASAQHRELPVWSEEQLHAFLDSVAEQRLYPLWRFLAMTGCRRGEALGLTWRDLDIENGRVAIVRALVPIDGRLVETEPKTKRGRRLIALDAETVAVLRQQAARQLAEQQALGDGWIDSGRVFTAENGAQLHPERISALFRRLVAAAALPPIPLHGLRHTYASLALAKGVNPAIVSRRWGMPPWPSPWISTPTCCPRSMPRRRRSSRRSPDARADTPRLGSRPRTWRLRRPKALVSIRRPARRGRSERPDRAARTPRGLVQSRKSLSTCESDTTW